jgi:CrcB protein
MNAITLVLIFVGGGIGSVLRYLIGLPFKMGNISLPIGTLLANISAAIIIAITFALANKSNISPRTLFFLTTGLCGGLSTFSTFSFETVQLFQQQQFGWAVINIMVTNLACIGLIAGISITK